jgi:predicted acyl esterase
VPDWPRVLFSVREHGERAHWHTDSQWPPARTEHRPLYLDWTGDLRVKQPAAEADVRYSATDPGARAQFDYTFDEPVELVGYMKLRLWVEAVGADDMDLFVAIQKLDTDGNLVPFPFYAEHDDGNVALGWLRVSHRELDEKRSTPSQPWHRHERQLLLEAGEPVAVDIEIWPSGTSFDRGDTLRLIVQGRDIYDYPGAIISRHEDTVNAGTHVIHVGGRFDSHLLVPVLADADSRATRS